MKTAVPLLLALALGAGGAGQPDAKQELKKLQGVWKVTAMEIQGKAIPKEMAPQEIKIAGNKLTGIGPEMTITLNPTKKPKWIDLAAGKDDKVPPMRAIYEIKGDELRLALPLASGSKVAENQRPESFDGQGKLLAVFTAKRVVEKKDKGTP